MIGGPKNRLEAARARGIDDAIDIEEVRDWIEAFGLREIGRIDRSIAQTAAIWGTTGQASREITMNTPGTPFGVRLVGFDPGSDVEIRQPSRGSDSG